MLFREPIVTSGQGLQMETNLLAKSGIFTEMSINMHCPCQNKQTNKQAHHQDVQHNSYRKSIYCRKDNNFNNRPAKWTKAGKANTPTHKGS